MQSIVIFVVITGAAWWFLSRALGQKVAGSDDPATSAGALPTVNLAAVPPLAQIPVAADDDEEAAYDESVDAFRASLDFVDIPELPGAVIDLVYEGDTEPRRVQVRQLLARQGSHYLDCWWPARADTRLFALHRIVQITDSAGVTYRDPLDWVVQSGPKGAALGERLCHGLMRSDGLG